jgi:8-amino-3,8-dideoxy-alpha-D-manno-octulosonate transaminase
MITVTWPSEFPGAHWLDQQEEDAVLDVLQHGSLFRYYGLKPPKAVDGYEAAARAYYGVKYALGINSGTGALITAMQALGVGPGSEVIVPAFLWVATVGAAVACNAIPVICEVDASFNLDPRDLERRITPRTKLIVPIHMAGSPCDMAAIMAVARQHRIAVLEDCAQCNGGEYRGQKVGTFGDIGIFSLQLNKNMTCGEGGLLITQDERLYHRIFSAHDMGMVRVNGRLAMPEADALAWGGGRRMAELCGAVAGVQLAKLPMILGHMRASHRRLRDALAGTPNLTLRQLHDDAGDTGLHIYSNIPSLVQQVPLSPAGNPWSLAENAASLRDYAAGACPASDALFARSILVPVPSTLTADQEAAAAAIIIRATVA